MTTTLDIAALVSAIIWPLALVILLLAYRMHLSVWIKDILSRLNKLGIPGLSLELSEAKAYTPEWISSNTVIDLRSKAASMQVSDSTLNNFTRQLSDQRDADYVEVDLGEGREWLTTRLFIMSILFARMKGVRGLLFLETVGGTRRKVIGIARPDHMRWALARRYPWLEQAYTGALSDVFVQQNVQVVSLTGRFSWANEPGSAHQAINLLSMFLTRVQNTGAAILPNDPEWIEVDELSHTREHARWITGRDLEELLGDALQRATLRTSMLRDKSAIDQAALIAEIKAPFVALVQEDDRLDRVIDKEQVLARTMKKMAATAANNA